MSAIVFCLFALAAPPAPEAAAEPPAATFQGPSSTRLARPAAFRIDPKVHDALPVVREGKPGSDFGTTDAPLRALRQYSMAAARRHFESATWIDDADDAATGKVTTGKQAKRKKAKRKTKSPRYEVVVTRVTVEAAKGPRYNVIVEVDRVEKGRRRGSATGRGMAVPDRSQQRSAASMAPGIFGMVASQKASRPRPGKSGDAIVLEQATIRALDSALLQIAAVWAGEQYVEDLRKSSR